MDSPRSARLRVRRQSAGRRQGKYLVPSPTKIPAYGNAPHPIRHGSPVTRTGLDGLGSLRHVMLRLLAEHPEPVGTADPRRQAHKELARDGGIPFVNEPAYRAIRGLQPSSGGHVRRRRGNPNFHAGNGMLTGWTTRVRLTAEAVNRLGAVVTQVWTPDT